ncbi:DUF2637 domain-containing protein [Nocardia lasii]|uniref:DUF2637 domain-containing protein n=1 Tax=Nocardia lasii TaxID=1616107 RepID=A0ABW1JUM7_9NOCA
MLSFAALRDLAVMAHTPTHLAWLFPVIVDGTIIQATIAVLALADSPERVFFTRVLIVGATVSIGGNVAHAMASGHGLGAAVLAIIAPAALLLDTHGLAVLLRARDAPTAQPPTEDQPMKQVVQEANSDSEPSPSSPEPVRPITAPPVRVVQPFQPPRPTPVAVPIPTGGN